MVKRLYEHRNSNEQHLDKLREQYLGKTESVKRTKQQMEDWIERLYYAELRHQVTYFKELKGKYEHHENEDRKKLMNKEELEAYIKRLYYDRKDLREETYKKLLAEIKMPEFKKVSKEEIDKTIERLYVVPERAAGSSPVKK